MAGTIRPVTPDVGQWYQDAETAEEFVVVGVEEDEGTVEIQNFDGTVGELSLDEWSLRPLSAIEPPEDWTGPVGALEEGDSGFDQESFELPPKHKPAPGYEQDEVLLSDEAKAHEELPGSEAE